MATIGLDLGHGINTYPPSKGVSGLPEHTFNAEVGIRLKKLLEFNGHKIVMGQEPYKNDVPLTTRTNLYNKEKVDLVWSIHANAGDPKTRGCAAFYWHNSADGKRLAEFYAEEVKAKGYPLWSGGIEPSTPGTWTDFHICRETNMVAILTENGFMTNAEDKKLLLSDKFRDDMADAHFRAISRYFKLTPKYPPKPQPVTKPIVSTSTLYKVQVGAFGDKKNAENLVKELTSKGYKPMIVEVKK